MIKINIVFIGDVLPQEIFQVVSRVAPSTNNLELNIIHQLHKIYKDNLYVISKNFKLSELECGKILIKEHQYKLSKEISVNSVKFINNRFLRNISGMYYLYKSLNSIKRTIKRKNKGNKIMYIIFNPYYQQSLPVYLVKGKNDIQVSIIGEGLDIRYIRNMKVRLYHHISHFINIMLLKKNIGIITYCSNTVEKYAPNVKSIELLHSIDISMFNGLDKIYNNGKIKKILYAGMLVNCYGINIMLDLMKRLPNNYNLILCGNGSSEVIEKIRVAEQKDNRIKYLGLLKKEEVIKLEFQVDILLLIRLEDTIVNRYIANYCQPSKIPEYLMSGTPVIATKIPAIPSVFDPYLNYVSSNVDDIANKVFNIVEDEDNCYSDKARNGRVFAQKNCTNNIQFSRLLKFIQSIEDGYNEK